MGAIIGSMERILVDQSSFYLRGLLLEKARTQPDMGISSTDMATTDSPLYEVKALSLIDDRYLVSKRGKEARFERFSEPKPDLCLL
jgi:hypothetical protein